MGFIEVLCLRGRASEGAWVALVSAELIPKAPTLHVEQPREYALANNVREVVSPSACFAGTSPRGRLVRLASLGSCRLSAAAAKRSQRLRRLDICGGAANVIRSIRDCCHQMMCVLLNYVRRLSAYGVGALPQTLQGLCP